MFEIVSSLFPGAVAFDRVANLSFASIGRCWRSNVQKQLCGPSATFLLKAAALCEQHERAYVLLDSSIRFSVKRKTETIDATRCCVSVGVEQRSVFVRNPGPQSLCACLSLSLHNSGRVSRGSGLTGVPSCQTPIRSLSDCFLRLFWSHSRHDTQCPSSTEAVQSLFFLICSIRKSFIKSHHLVEQSPFTLSPPLPSADTGCQDRVVAKSVSV